jgi:heme exporter protein D
VNWNSAGEFFAMGGYAVFVWGSFGACAVAVAAEIVLVGRRRAAVLRQLRERIRAESLAGERP